MEANAGGPAQGIAASRDGAENASGVTYTSAGGMTALDCVTDR